MTSDGTPPANWNGTYTTAYGAGYKAGVHEACGSFDEAQARGYDRGYSKGFELGERRAQQLVLRQAHQGQQREPDAARRSLIGGIVSLALILSTVLALAFWQGR